MIGLNTQLLSDYIEWIANKRMQAGRKESSSKQSLPGLLNDCGR